MKVTRVIDADTIGVEMVVRLAGIYAPEKDTPEGGEAMRYVTALLPEGTNVDVRWYFPEARYNRPAADIIIKSGPSKGKDLGDILVAQGKASRGVRPKTARVQDITEKMLDLAHEYRKLVEEEED